MFGPVPGCYRLLGDRVSQSEGLFNMFQPKSMDAHVVQTHLAKGNGLSWIVISEAKESGLQTSGDQASDPQAQVAQNCGSCGVLTSTLD